MTDQFLDPNYKIPEKSQYTKFSVGENRLRILISPILGWEWWEDGVREDGTKKGSPKRVRMNEPVPEEHIEEAKHFWAMVVWNYNDECIQILERSEETIQRALRALSRNVKWGNPKTYDIVIDRTGQSLQDTEYEVIPEPPTPVDERITTALVKHPVNLEALYEGKDPFQK